MIDMHAVYRDFERQQTRQLPPEPSEGIRMTFGKHIGVAVDRVPKGYLRWVSRNVKPLDPPLALAIDRHLSGLPIEAEAVSGDSSEAPDGPCF